MDIGRRQEAAARFILDHTKVSYLLWILIFFLMINPIALTAPLDEPPRFGWAAWIVVAELASTPILLLRFKPPAGKELELLLIRWALAQTPLLFSYVALYDRAPQWLSGIAFVEAIVLMAFSVRRTRRELAAVDSQGKRKLAT